jgi:hypothetical protein
MFGRKMFERKMFDSCDFVSDCCLLYGKKRDIFENVAFRPSSLTD